MSGVEHTSNFAQIADAAVTGLTQGLTLAAEGLLALSLEQVPMRQLDLAGSGGVVPAADPDEGAAVTYDTPYATRLHEHPEYQFSKKANPGAKGKYVEDPAMEKSAELGKVISTQINRATGRWKS